MNIKRILYFPHSEIILAILLGFGLATLFRKTCGNKSCLVYKGPSLDEIKNNVYTIGDSCYKFVPNQTQCSVKQGKEVLEFS